MKILFINVPADGHVNPTLALVKELVDRGNKVVYYIDEPLKSKVKKMGAEVRSSNTPTIDDINFELVLHYLKTNIDFIEKLINEKEHFDCLIHDSFYFFGKKVGQFLGIKTISSHTTFAKNNEMLAEIMKNQVGKMYAVFAQFRESQEAKSVLRKYKELLKMDFFAEILNLMAEKADLNIVYTSRFFQPREETFDESFKFVGPSVIDRKEKMDLQLDYSGNEKIIFISHGTVYNKSLNFYLTCFEAFKDMDCRFVMSAGKSINIESLGDIPENFTVHNYVPQLEVLRKASAFITHGGMNSTSEGLYFGLPLLVIPQEVDQPIVARQVETLGAGIVVDKDNITSQILRSSLEKILNDESYKENAMLVRKSFINSGGYKKAVDEILNLLEDDNQSMEKAIII